MDLKLKLKSDLKDGMRSGETDRVSVLRLLFSVIKNKEIEKGRQVQLTDDEIISIIVTAAKQRRESIVQYKKAGREDLSEKESRELNLLLSYLPEPFSEDELRDKVKEAILKTGITEIKQMGLVMKLLVPQLRGRSEGDAIRRMVQLCLQENSG